ncbi:MAG: M36 family metallopeptidase [Proteobacteria bacterium]|jgi:hypothetical protein|nr:M36 family metallopeptidase [Pseudomonadota bacterium]
MKKIIMALLLVNLGCGELSQFQAGALDSSSEILDDGTQGAGGDGSIQLTFLEPTSNQVPRSKFIVKFEASPLSEVRNLQLLVNNQIKTRFSRVPFQVEIDPNQYPGSQIEIRIESSDKLQKKNFRVLRLKRAPTSQTLVPDSRTFGVFDSNCLHNSQYDACLFWKNPVAQKGAPYLPALDFGAAIPEQTFGVSLKNLRNPASLSNDSLQVFSSGSPEAKPQGSHWRYAYSSDAQNHFIAQIMAFFWLDKLEEEMLRRSGQFYASKKNIPVDAFNTSVQNNAYWDTQKIVMGVSTAGGGRHEMALSAEVYIHEMGHANLQYAVGRFLRDSHQGSSQGTCSSHLGCISAINEGQADFTFLMIFQDSTALGETFVNSTRGIGGPGGLLRDVNQNQGLKTQEIFLRSQGQIHTLGTVLATILYDIYTQPIVDKVEFEKIFMNSLTKLSESSRFPETKSALLAEDQILYGGKYKQVIENAFQKMGL